MKKAKAKGPRFSTLLDKIINVAIKHRTKNGVHIEMANDDIRYSVNYIVSYSIFIHDYRIVFHASITSTHYVRTRVSNRERS